MSRHLLLNFHGVGKVSRPYDAGEEAFWLEESDFLAVLDEVAVAPSGVSLTFDDGNLSDRQIVAPALRERGLRGEFFVLVHRLDQPGFLPTSALAELVDMGMIIGSHGARHVPWRGLDTEALTLEIQGARAFLEDILQLPVPRVACPFGSYDRRVLGHLRRAGIERVYTSDRGAALENAWVQARNTLHRGEGAGALARVRSEANSPAGRILRTVKSLAKRYR